VCLDISMVVEGFHGNRGLLPSSTRVRLLKLIPALPAAHHLNNWSSGE